MLAQYHLCMVFLLSSDFLRNMLIALSNLEFYAFHGVLEQERQVGGAYLIDVELDVEVSSLAYDDDDLSGTVNYAQVYETIKAEMKQSSKLLEHLVMRICRKLLREFTTINGVKISLTKVNPPMGAACKGATVTLSLDRNDKRC